MVKPHIQSSFYGEWNDTQREKRMAAQRRAYAKLGLKPKKPKKKSGAWP